MSYRHSQNLDYPSAGVISGAIIAALLASVSLGGLLAGTGHLEAVPALYGLEGYAWTLVIAHGVVGAVPFIVGLTRVARVRHVPTPVAAASYSPFLGGCFGIAYATVCWLVGVVYGVPFFVGLTGGTLPMPYHHTPSLVALIGYGAILGSWYPLVRTAIDDCSPSLRR